ncbi:hypothetical protein EEB13_15205 [Rhodococcus sp. WS3]|nr:hypothetical protein EEB13_15205 [Rhodococcus sp. WS3]
MWTANNLGNWPQIGDSVQPTMMMDLLRAHYWFEEALAGGLRRHGWTDVGRAQSLILANLANLANLAFGVRRPSTLAGNIGLTQQAVSNLASRVGA